MRKVDLSDSQIERLGTIFAIHLDHLDDEIAKACKNNLPSKVVSLNEAKESDKLIYAAILNSQKI